MYTGNGSNLRGLSACTTRLDCIMYGVKAPGNPDCSVYPYQCSDGSGKCYTKTDCERIKAAQPAFVQGILNCTNYPATCGGTTTTGSKCATNGGTCIDVNKQNCSTPTATGQCPGASNIRCCSGTVTNKSSSGSSSGGGLFASTPKKSCADLGGTCKPTSECTGNTIAGYCSGASNIQCCTPRTAPPSSPTYTPSIPDGTSYASFPWWLLIPVAVGVYLSQK